MFFQSTRRVFAKIAFVRLAFCLILAFVIIPSFSTKSSLAQETPEEANPAKDKTQDEKSEEKDPLSGLELGELSKKRNITEVKITGNRLVLDEELYELISLHEGDDFDKSKVLDDLQAIYGTGYFERSNINAKPIYTEDGVILEYTLQEQDPISAIEIYGNENISEVDAHSFFANMIGKPENIKLLSEQMQALELEYAKAGFIIAKIQDINLEDDGTLQVFLNEGLIDEVAFIGNEKTQTSYLQKLASQVKAGDVYNENIMQKDFKKLNGTGYFAEVSRSLKPIEGKDSYKLEIQLQEKKNITVGLGGGVNTRSGLFGNVNLNWGNVRGLGHRYSLNGMIGSGFGANSSFDNTTRLFRRRRITQIGTRYAIPYFRDTNDTLSLFGNYFDGNSFFIDRADQSNYTLGTELSRPFAQGTLRGSISYNLIDLGEDDSTDDFDNSYNAFLTGAILEEKGFTIDDKFENTLKQLRRQVAKQLRNRGSCADLTGDCRTLANRRVRKARLEARANRKDQLQDGSYLRFRPAYVYSNLDNPNKPREGWKASIDLEQAMSFADFDSFTKINTSVTRYFPLPKESTFLINFRTGYNALGNLPLFAQYRLGGFTGVRGYRPFTDLGVGRSILMGTAEFRTPIYNIAPPLKNVKFMKNIDLALFADAGLAGENTRLNRLSDRLSRAVAAGFGLRFNIPLAGAIRVDVGFPLVEVLGEDNNFFNFNFGLANRF